MINHDESMKTNMATLWWKRSPDDRYEVLINEVGLYRIMQRNDRDRDQVIFQCKLPAAREFLHSLHGAFVEVRYTGEGTLDNPHTTTPIVRFSDIRPKNLWSKRIVPLLYSSEPVITFVQASCHIMNKDNFLFLGKLVKGEHERLENLELQDS